MAGVRPLEDSSVSNARNLCTAQAIGARLVREALWHAGRCNWLGMLGEETQTQGSRPGVKYGALGPDLYAGTSGVALLLAELYAVSSDRALRRTALGAMRQALQWAEAIPSSVRLGLYAGWVGIAYAAVRVALLVDEPGLLQRATRLLRSARRCTATEHEYDLIGGNAGAVAALIALHGQLQESWLLDFAAQLGDELVQAARETPGGGSSWPSVTMRWRHHLTGFSHGAAGIGFALLELHRATADVAYRRVAERAFVYEQRWYDTGTRNWADLREVQVRRARCGGQLPAATFWCHGAPGIALSRARAYSVLGTTTYRTEALNAQRTTRVTVEALLATSSSDFSLCHGLAGLADVLSVVGPVVDSSEEETRWLVQRVAERGIQWSLAAGMMWPCGTGAGETPGLMLGLAGIGWFYLRVANPSFPSVLVVGGEQAAKRGN